MAFSRVVKAKVFELWLKSICFHHFSFTLLYFHYIRVESGIGNPGRAEWTPTLLSTSPIFSLSFARLRKNDSRRKTLETSETCKFSYISMRGWNSLKNDEFKVPELPDDCVVIYIHTHTYIYHLGQKVLGLVTVWRSRSADFNSSFFVVLVEVSLMFCQILSLIAWLLLKWRRIVYIYLCVWVRFFTKKKCHRLCSNEFALNFVLKMDLTVRRLWKCWRRVSATIL